ncbi:MAG: hypothetical protein WC890_07275 [Candidatus Margulisiibacteriota bacterium]
MLFYKQVIPSILMVLIAASILAFGCGTSNSHTPYNFKELGYSIIVPNSWGLKSRDNKMTRAWESPDKELMAALSITPVEISKNNPLINDTPKLLTNKINRLIPLLQKDGYIILSTGKSKIGGLDGCYLITSYYESDYIGNRNLVFFDNYFVRNGNRTYHIICSYLDIESTTAKPILQQILKSIKFKK